MGAMTRPRRPTTVLASLLLFAGLLTIGPAPAARAATCGFTPAGLETRTIGARSYLIHVPAGLTAAAPLLLSLHGLGAGARLHATDTGWVPFADANRFIVAFPQGNGKYVPSWQFGQHSPDVAFIRQVVADIESTWCVDPRRVHVTGHSNGALMALRLACDAADLFGSVAEDAGGPPTATGTPCTPTRPISVGIFSSTFDPLSLLAFGYVTRNQWVTLDQCPKTPVKEPGVLLEASRYAPCAAGTEVIWRAYLAQSHNWPRGADRADILQRMWALFVRNPLP